jgi:hypothetical protein
LWHGRRLLGLENEATVERSVPRLPVSNDVHGRKRRMGKPAISVLYALGMVAVVVGVDVLFFRGSPWFWPRLAANVGIVLVFGAFYVRFLR